VRSADIKRCTGNLLLRELRVLFVLNPPLATGLFSATGAFWHRVVRVGSLDLRGLRYSILSVSAHGEPAGIPVATELERALQRQQARRAHPAMDCLPEDEISVRVWLCGTLAAWREPRPALPMRLGDGATASVGSL